MTCLGLALLALSSNVTPAGEAGPGAPRAKVTTSVKSFESGDKPITAEWFRPERKGPHPAVLLLHEAGGMHPEAAPLLRKYCTLLAGEGYVVLLVHYFDRTGQKGINPRIPENVRQGFDQWKDTVRDAVKLLARDPGVNAKSIGLLGFSLGSFLALSVAMDRELGVAAVASVCGGLPDDLWPDLKHLPPVLLIGCKQDRMVSVAKCYALRAWCQENRVACEFRVFDKQGHLFAEDLKKYGVAASLMSQDVREAHRQVSAFFARQLRQESKSTSGP
jgi:carboxymethylenebutenolidase